VNETVVLVHGLWMHGAVMAYQRARLARRGYRALCYSYPSVRLGLSENAARLARFARTLDASRIHWVGHSLGALVILRMLEQETDLPGGRVVLLGAPYRDTYAGRAMAASALGARMVGRGIAEWLTLKHPHDYAGCEIGVVAGCASVGMGRLVVRGLPAPNDGVVALAETEMAAARDRIVLRVSHSGMLFSRAVARRIAEFLRDGRFNHDERAR
jgi:pimeloyl-ACP methyl ester carboxylesterase